MTAPPPEITEALQRLGLLPEGAPATGAPLTGGVSSDIWRIDTPDGPICAKRALSRLKVEADWRAPIERNIYEARWLERAGRVVPGAVPRMLGQDADAGVLALEWLDPGDHPVWKSEMLAGRVDPEFAAKVGDTLGRIHSATAIKRDPSIAADFPTDDIFYAIRLEPYLAATASAWPALAAPILALLERTAASKHTLVHGDVSPKNILASPNGPIFIDAECAWAGDPAFDLAFCLNHLLLKRIPRPDCSAALSQSFLALKDAYMHWVDWESRTDMEARTASLLPALLLARVDGKSPAEYITGAADKARIRAIAIPLIQAPPHRLSAVNDAWK